jgi:hypothetical protein
VDFDAGLGEPAGVHVRSAVDGDHALASPGESQRSRLPGTGEAEDQRVHPTRSGRKSKKYR